MLYRAVKAVKWECEVLSWGIGQKTGGGIVLLHTCQANRYGKLPHKKYITEMIQKMPMLTFSNGHYALQKKRGFQS